MSDGTGIQWAQATWNPVVGCTRVSAGCDHCYAVGQSWRLERMVQTKYAGLTVLNNKGDRHFNGVVRTKPESLTIPLAWKKPKRIFVNSMSDLFHEKVPFEFIDRVFGVMALCPRHTFIVLTKRPERAAEYFAARERGRLIFEAAVGMNEHLGREDTSQFGQRVRDDGQGAESVAVLPLRNLWLLASCEDQKTLDERVPWLLKCPAAVRGLSLEPLLGDVDLTNVEWGQACKHDVLSGRNRWNGRLEERVDWVITGVESRQRMVGRGAAEYPERAGRVIQQCQAAGVPIFNKQMPGDDGNVCGEPCEWSEPWRVREFPELAGAGMGAEA